MTIRSMTGFAQLKGEQGSTAYTLSAKSVNHRFLDLHLRLPGRAELFEQQLRKLLKEKLHRGHIELTLALEYAGASGISVNRELVQGYVTVFRQLSAELGLSGEPDLNAVLRLNGALSGSSEMPEDEVLQARLLEACDELIEKLNAARRHEGEQMCAELLRRMESLEQNTDEVALLRDAVVHAHRERLSARMNELLEGRAEPERILQEAALLAERSDVQEEIVRMKTHIRHFRQLLQETGEVGKKLDFLLQEMSREANTMLSKTTGLAGDATSITALGLAMKSDIEKSREQVQNIE